MRLVVCQVSLCVRTNVCDEGISKSMCLSRREVELLYLDNRNNGKLI